MYIDREFPPPRSWRVAKIVRTVRAFERNEIEAAVDGLIALLDEADGDVDREVTGIEDDFMTHPENGPGCPVADIDNDKSDYEPDDDDRCEAGDDHMIAGPVSNRQNWHRIDWLIGDEADGEPSECNLPIPTYAIDQQRCLEAPRAWSHRTLN